jgi:hypothetical protein
MPPHLMPCACLRSNVGSDELGRLIDLALRHHELETVGWGRDAQDAGAEHRWWCSHRRWMLDRCYNRGDIGQGLVLDRAYWTGTYSD